MSDDRRVEAADMEARVEALEARLALLATIVAALAHVDQATPSERAEVERGIRAAIHDLTASLGLGP